MGGSSAPTVWPLQCKQTWSWRAFPPWRTKVCSSVVPSAATLSPARQRSTEPSGRCARRACSATGRTTGPRVGLPAHSLNPGWSNPAWRAPTLAECRPSGGTAAGSCSSFTTKQSGWRDGAKRWSERRRSTTCRRRVSVLKGAWRQRWSRFLFPHFFLLETCIILTVLLTVKMLSHGKYLISKLNNSDRLKDNMLLLLICRNKTRILCVCFSPRKDPECCWKCSAFNVSKVPAVLLAVPTEPGEWWASVKRCQTATN